MTKAIVVLLMIGTNDMQWGWGEDAPERHGDLLEKVWHDLPNCAAFVAKTTPFARNERVDDKPDGELLDPIVRRYNAVIADVVPRKAAAGRRAFIVDQDDRFDPGTCLKDNCHPNDVGNRVMAQKMDGGDPSCDGWRFSVPYLISKI